MNPEVTTLLEILVDGEWHRLGELQQQLGLAESKVKRIAAFLHHYDFAIVDQTKRKMKVTRDFQKFLMQT